MRVEDKVAALEQILIDTFGKDFKWDDSAHRTAERVINAWGEFKPLRKMDFNFTVFPTTVNQMILVKDIEFSSICAHHLFPYYGVAHVAYLPNELMVGVSKIPRLVKYYAQSPSTQEWLTAKIASEMKHRLSAQGVAVVIEARHTCMACRGVKVQDAGMTTSEMRGIFLTSSEARIEFLTLINHKGV